MRDIHEPTAPPLTVAVGSRNPVKLAAVEQAFPLLLDRLIVTRPVDVPTAPTQPLSDQETLAGARHRAERAHVALPSADFWVGIEGGVDSVEGTLMAIGWVVVRHQDVTGISRTASFELPEQVAVRIRQGAAMGDLSSLAHADRPPVTGLVGALTVDRITRESLYVQPLMLALMRSLPVWVDVSSRV
ncbi:inosine/xanthosine triphosphatase [Micromonospora sp. WMMD1120]|uniref:inosine/xanthosine triphosphatase n=1 Tax=Micromonospora sp. WMMD1120 TaxID=3016106 RepID=UPI002417ADAB|nr:inosine/xanthosine triphosphatase [Micromonospora sp. WMMD1120]MDG4808856.1 inosine/xanthosine triphosphatase [Micromonospora sp. WMMD1120]